jgi:hypothetical protein
VLLGVSADRPAVARGDLPLPALVRPAPVRGCLPAGVRFRGVVVRCGVAALSSVRLSATTRLTPYTAPITRNTSANGSLESMVTFNDIPFRMAPLLDRATSGGNATSTTAPPPREAAKPVPCLRTLNRALLRFSKCPLILPNQ